MNGFATQFDFPSPDDPKHPESLERRIGELWMGTSEHITETGMVKQTTPTAWLLRRISIAVKR